MEPGLFKLEFEGKNSWAVCDLVVVRLDHENNLFVSVNEPVESSAVNKSRTNEDYEIKLFAKGARKAGRERMIRALKGILSGSIYLFLYRLELSVHDVPLGVVTLIVKTTQVTILLAEAAFLLISSCTP